MLSRTRDYPSDKLYREADVLDIRQLFFFEVFLVKYEERLKLNYIEHDYHTRSVTQQKTRTAFCSTTVGRRSLEYLGNRLFNFLPHEIRNLKTRKKFVVRTKTFLMERSRNLIGSLME
ncbi:hypothetical protein WA026_012583 [Henosepilachna vigintioctopunctata]|uniref:Uncharacterized protein n=1 Tax=Henosepilachna vigintioctopunctata TaxID=420089 RepID=A0AAW1U8P1_9CUCU